MTEPTFHCPDWTSSHVKHWQKLLNPIAGKPGLRMLEVGVLEGRSSIWFLQNVLTCGQARLVAVDPAPQSNFTDNLKALGLRSKVELHRLPSGRCLPTFAHDQFDVAYIDGSHEARDVARDGFETLPLMKPGGIIVFDDYQHKNCNVHFQPEIGVNAFPSHDLACGEKFFL